MAQLITTDPASLEGLTLAQIGDISDDITQNTMSRFPFLDTLMGRPGRDGRPPLTRSMFGAEGYITNGMKVQAGTAIHEQVNFKEPTAGLYIQHLDPWPYAREDYNTWMIYPWRYNAMPIATSYQEKWENRGGSGHNLHLLDIIDNRVEQKKIKQLQDINNDLVTSAGGATLPNGLPALIPSDPTVAGTTIGQIDVSVYTDLRPKYNADMPGAPAAGAAGSFPADYRDNLIDIINQIQAHYGTGGDMMFLGGRDLWQSYYAIQHARETTWRQIDSSNPNAIGSEGYKELFLMGIPFVWDPFVPNGTLYLLSFPGIHMVCMQDVWNYMLPWRELEDRAGRGTACVCGFQLVLNQPRAQFGSDGWTT